MARVLRILNGTETNRENYMNSYGEALFIGRMRCTIKGYSVHPVLVMYDDTCILRKLHRTEANRKERRNTMSFTIFETGIVWK